MVSQPKIEYGIRFQNANPSTSLARIEPRLNVPVNAILVAATFNLLFGLLYLGIYTHYPHS